MSQTPPSDMNISQNVNDFDDNSLQTNTETNVNDINLNTNSIPNQSDVYMKSDSSSDTPSEVYTNEHEITPQLTPEIKSEEEQEIHNDGPLLSVKPLNETTDVIPTDSFPLKKSNENNIQEIDNEIVEILEEIEVPLSKTIPCLQIIDQDGLFADEEQSNEQSFEEFLKDIPSFTKLGFNYNMLSILGPQNSGKSTLLNYLFDTDFAVLDQTLKRQRTTRGVWLGVVGKRQDVLIMDLEGSDGSAREDDYSFERKISLFSLSVCSVLMVNIWSHDVGRYGASNMSLLKNVFELNLQLFQKEDSPRTLILFVIRDRDQRKPFSSTRDALLEDIMKIWDTVARPDCFKRAPIGKFFDLEFTSLPHFKHDKEQFIKEAKELKKRFDSQNPDTYFRDIYNKEIPADGLSIFTKQVWGTIKSNKDLDLPSQKEMLARYRCDEIIETIYEEYEMEASAVKYAHAEMKQFDNFKEFVDTLFDEKMKQFMTIASKYLDRVVKEKSEVLSEKMLNDISYMFQTQTNIIINHIKKMLTTKYSTLKAQYIQEQSKDFDPSTYESYAEQMDEFNSNIVDEWKKISTENVPNNVENTFGVGIDALGRFIHKLYEIGRRDLIDALMTHFKKHLQKIMKPVLYPIFEKTEKDMWEQVRNVVKETTSNNLEKLKNGMINSLKMDNTEVELKLEELNSYITDAVRLTILERPSFVNMLMENKFISLFRNDKDGLPRKWKANDDLSKPYFHASEEAEKILDLFSYIRIDPKDDEMSFTSINPATGKKMLIEEPEDALIIPEKILFTLGERISMYDSFKHMTEVAFMRAQQEQAAVTVHAKTPLWLILLILFVAFDNVLWVIQSPILLTIVLVIGGGIFALTKMGYSQEIDNILSHILSFSWSSVLYLIQDLGLLKNLIPKPEAPQRKRLPKKELKDKRESIIVEKKPISPSIPLTESSDMSFDDIDNLESFDDAFQLVQSTQPTQRKQFLPKYDKSNQMTASTPTLASVAKSQSFTTYPLPSTKSPITNHEI